MFYIFVIFIAVAISFEQSVYYASEAQGSMNVTLMSSIPLNFSYSIIIVLIQSNPVSASGDNDVISMTHDIIMVMTSHDTMLLMSHNIISTVSGIICTT